jgi:CubicO group peptidase (beta-lactamase class C family)
MKTKHLLIVVLSIVFAFAGCNKKNQNPPKRHVPSEKELSAFESRMTTLAKEMNIQGLSYALVNESQVIQTKGIGYTDKKEKTDDQTVYKIGAMADIFAATLVLQLSEKEKLDVKNYVSEYITGNVKAKDANIKSVLSHTSGEKPGTVFSYDPKCFDMLGEVIKTSSGKSFPELLKKNITRRLGMKQTTADNNESISDGCISSVSDLAKFSLALDNKKQFQNENSCDVMFRPVYLKNGELTPSALGWFVQFYNDKKYVWSFGQGKDFSSLIIKSLTDSLTLIVLANTGVMNIPFDLQKGNVFNSPVALEFFKTFIFRDSTLATIDINQPDDKIRSSLENVNKSKHRMLLVNEYISFIKLSQYLNQPDKSKHLIDIYSQVLPLEVPWNLLEKQPSAIIEEAGDYVNIKKQFHIDNDTVINILGVGEFVKEMTLNPYEYDIAEIYFDMKNKKNKSFDNTINRQYRFDYDYNEITGNFSTSENIKFIQGDPSKTSYLFEIKFPWKTLDSIVPVNGYRLGFDINVTDNDDGKGRKSFITWHFKGNEQAWADASVYGTMLLSSQNLGNSNDSTCLSIKTKTPVIIDGKMEGSWNVAPRYKLNRTAGGFDKYPDGKDLSAWFRSVWDEENLYILVEVTDNIKCILPNSGDFGWIENEKQDTIWMMQPGNTKYAGGAETNKYVNTTIPLKKGNYTLNYKTDQTNSFNRWIRKQPEISFYGIAVY